MCFEFPMRGERLRLTSEIRSGKTGLFVELPDGMTHYELAGKPGDPSVVLVHGFSVPYFIWDPTFDALVQAGYRVLRYDLFGRGYSDRPHLANDLDFFVRQLEDLLEKLDISQVRAVVGLSMGGTIAAEFCARYPERVEKLGLFDPAGLPTPRPYYLRLIQIPLVGELTLGLINEKLFEKLVEKDFYEPELVETFIDRFLPQMQYKGFRRSLLSTIRSGLLETGAETYAKIGMSSLLVLLVWGENDRTAPFGHHTQMLQYIPQAMFHPIPDSGHIPHYEQAGWVNQILLDFLQHE